MRPVKAQYEVALDRAMHLLIVANRRLKAGDTLRSRARRQARRDIIDFLSTTEDSIYGVPKKFQEGYR